MPAVVRDAQHEDALHLARGEPQSAASSSTAQLHSQKGFDINHDATPNGSGSNGHAKPTAALMDDLFGQQQACASFDQPRCSRPATADDKPDPGWCKDSNFRDIASIDGPCKMRRGRIFRCSQFHTAELRDRLKIKCVLDLRKSDKECSKWGRKGKELLHPEWVMVRAKNLAPSSVAPRCPICESSLNKEAARSGVEVRTSRSPLARQA